MSEQTDHKHQWKIRFDGNFASDHFGELFAYCYYGGCSARLSRAEIERRLVAGEHIAELEAEIVQLKTRIGKLTSCIAARGDEIIAREAEIAAWETKAAEFVDQGELVEQLKAVLLTIRDEVIGESAGKTWACRYAEEINKLLSERMKKEQYDDQTQPQPQA